ncbi:MAG: leucine-rich repeat domain-containing protein [Prevotella sp.]|nr:leucine-rich repeat domain-containing protein [Prevotella sp.]
MGSHAFASCKGFTSIELPSTITTIGTYAFDSCTGLTSITIPSGVTSISDYTFEKCTALTSITLPSGVTSIGSYALYQCPALTSIEIPASVTSIGSDTFYSCTSLVTVTFAENSQLTSIDSWAFYGCTEITSIEIPSSVTSIGAYAFRSTGLTSIVIPSGVTSMGEYVFQGCDSLTEIKVDESNEHYHSEDGVLYSTDEHTLIQYPVAKTATTFKIPSDVKRIYHYALQNNESLVTVTSDKDSQLEFIGTHAFEYCHKLESAILGCSVDTIREYAFYDCSAFKDLVCFNSTPALFPSDKLIFGNTSHRDDGPVINLFVPVGAKEAYCTDERNSGNGTATWKPENAIYWSFAIKEFMEANVTLQEAAVISEVAETSEDDGEDDSEEVKYGYSTFYTGKPFYTSYSYPLTNNLKCATASVSDGTLTMNWAYGNNSEPDVVPGGTAVVLYGPLGTNYPVIYEDDDEGVTASVAAVSEDNMLLGSEVETTTHGPDGETDGYIYYMLSYSEKNANGECENMGFYYGAPDGAAFMSNANKAWLPVPNDGSGAKITSFVFGYDAGETTAIRTVDSSKPAADVIYNLQGVRVNDMNRKGIYIVGGKKVIKK